MRTFYEVEGAPAEAAVERATRVVRETIQKDAAGVDREGRFPRPGLRALGAAGLLGLTVPKKHGGLELGPRAFAAIGETIGGACASTGMVYVMHVCATNCIVARPPAAGDEL